MKQIVTVVDIEGENALVRSEQSGCQGCASKSACAVLDGQQKTKLALSVPNRLLAKVGDRVVLVMDDRLMLRVTFWLYGMPMLAFIGSGLLVHALATALAWASVDLWAVGGACLGMTAMWRVSAWLDVKPDVEMSHFHTDQTCSSPELRSKH